VNRTHVAVFIGAAAIMAAVGAGTGLVLTVSPSPSPAPVQAGPGRAGGGYGPAVGGAPPGWAAGGPVTGSMMGGQGDPGTVMGRALAGAPGTRVSEAEATRLATEVSSGASVDRAGRRVVFRSASVRLAAVAGAPGAGMYSFEIAGLVNPTLVVPAGARVSIDVVNADDDMAHGLVVTSPGAGAGWMPMMGARPSFPGTAVWALGEATGAGLHTATEHFTATMPGRYQYLCAVPGHAQRGMAGTFIVSQK
jgi:rusticyanin